MKKKISILLEITLFLLIIYSINRLFIEDKKIYQNKDFNIKNYISVVDYDNDGIDDQSDILKGALEYIKTKPKYKSKYYSTGYPLDNYGVCTDVVAKALKSAGYDLMELVYQDISSNKKEYDIDKIDKNIDFRRVKNLIIYFKRNTISLTTDISKIDKWQGGDIVIFKKHIGVVSNKRNKFGVPYIIHHESPYQLHYEEDILGTRSDIVGHYRIS